MLLNLIIEGNNSSFRLDIIHNFLLTQKDTDFTIILAQSLKVTHASQLQQVRDHETNKVIIKLLIRLWQQNISFTEGAALTFKVSREAGEDLLRTLVQVSCKYLSKFLDPLLLERFTCMCIYAHANIHAHALAKWNTETCQLFSWSTGL